MCWAGARWDGQNIPGRGRCLSKGTDWDLTGEKVHILCGR